MELAKLIDPDERRLGGLLEQYGEVFGEPQSLPLWKGTDHHIELVPRAK